uniref:Chromosome 4 open reading frame 54 n=1 Tax=Amphilophus citrinellus TaxID=61819 RepID=A0A3Q0SMN0_AMPCI
MKTEKSCAEISATRRQVKDQLQKPTEDVPEKQDERKYVDLELLDVKTEATKPQPDRRFSERNQMSLIVSNSGTGAPCAPERKDLAIKSETANKTRDKVTIGKCGDDVKQHHADLSSPSVPFRSNAKSEDFLKSGDTGGGSITQHEVSKTESNGNLQPDEELDSGDNYLGGRSELDDYEVDDDVSLVLSDDCVPCATEDESHYITTHEIQLSELSDHEEDYEAGAGSSTSWDIEDDNQVYSFVDYASFDGDGAVGERGDGHRPRSQGAAATVSTLLESDLPDAAKFTSSNESVSKPEQQHCSGNSAGQIHLSIRTTSRAINDPSNIQEQENILYHARRSGDMSHYVCRGVDGEAETLCDRAKCFVAAPGRLHFGGKLRGKEVTEYSSGTSSAVSELDDADKEVRNLTARAFKSLAYPYFDAINFSTSSESSASEHGVGINRWSTFVDLKYGNMNMDQSVVSHQSSAASFEIAKTIDSRGYKGTGLPSIKAPTNKILTLNGNPQNASSSSKKLELMGKFGQSHSGMIRLTETLNFRCNVKSGMSAGERRTNFTQNATGSRSTDEVTNGLLRGQSRGASKPPSKTMEDTHKKAIFASSLIKNVISKKMQFEQERKMERGEISEPQQTPSPCFLHQDSDCLRGKASRELHRQSSKFSESSSDYAIICLNELGDIVDSGSCDTKSDFQREETAAPAAETNLEPANEVGMDTKKGAREASKSTLLRSQNSAFRCWKDEELEFQKDHKNGKTPGEKLLSANDKEGEVDRYSADNSKLKKMSHLFVPSIQLLPSEGEATHQLLTSSKSPEIKINLRRVKDNKTEPFGVSKLRAHNIGCNTSNLTSTDHFNCQALATALKGESSDKVPHFMVRDIRDNKGKLQTPIYQVRDVRKLVKSSYHFVSLDNNENKSNIASADSHPEQQQNKQLPNQNIHSVSPIVIKCQSVNTNGKQSGNPEVTKREPFDADRSPLEGVKNAQRAAGTACQLPNNSSQGNTGLRSESSTSSKKQEKISDIIDKKPASKLPNQAALEKLQAAVKTMEQLYVFEKNEWKRKNEPQPLTDSHVLSMIASEEHAGYEEETARGSNVDKCARRDSHSNTDKALPAGAGESLLRQEEKDLLKALPTPGGCDGRPKSVQAPSTTESKNMFSLSSSVKVSTTSKMPQPNTITQTPFSTKSFVPKSPKLPRSLTIKETRPTGNEEVGLKEVDRFAQEFSADSENYLAIPVKSHPSKSKQSSSADKAPVYMFSTQSHPTTPPGHVESGSRGPEDYKQTAKHSSIVMETRSPEIPSATIYHSLPLGMSANQSQVYCFSPAITPAPTLDPFQATQRKMLLDPTTGNYYLVDTPVQPATKRLFDPETGQYVDVPMPQPSMTPVPMAISPLALNPGIYGHTYMIYPGLMPPPSVIPSRAFLQSQMSVQSEVESDDKTSSQQTEGMYIESPFYMSTGKSSQVASGVQQQAAANRPQQGFSSIKQPVISITSQQGPRIIAPPSFDGTTMSFVVEHR